ncbi:MAG: NADH-quinone oxidoreductase subunit I [bacterium]|nr:NADH-quinone oxidoreductase subunit I [bacterium]
MAKDEDCMVISEPQLSAAERMYMPQIAGGAVTTMRHMLKVLFGKGSLTVHYPEETRALRAENYRGVHRLNRDEQGRVACVACFMCATACPANCIHIEAGEAPWPDREKYPVKFEIDELRCIFCGMCEEACPVDAIELTPVYDLVGLTRAQMNFDKDRLLEMYDRTKDAKPRKNPRITGYPGTGNRSSAAPEKEGSAS